MGFHPSGDLWLRAQSNVLWWEGDTLGTLEKRRIIWRLGDWEAFILSFVEQFDYRPCPAPAKIQPTSSFAFSCSYSVLERVAIISGYSSGDLSGRADFLCPTFLFGCTRACFRTWFDSCHVILFYPTDDRVGCAEMCLCGSGE